MALIFMDGFDGYLASGNAASRLTEQWTNVFSYDNGIQVVPGRYTGKGLQFYCSKGSTTRMRMPFTAFGPDNAGDSAKATKLIFGFNFRKTESQVGNHFTYFQIGTNRYITFYNNTVTWSTSYAPGTHLASITYNQWYNIELVMTGTQANSGSFNVSVYVNDIFAGSFSATFSTSYSATYFEFGSRCEDYSYRDSKLQIDDVYAINNTNGGLIDRIGPDARIETLVPTAPKDSVDVWDFNGTGVTSTSDAVDNIPYDIAKFAGTGTADTVQEFEFENLTNIKAVKGAQLRSMAKGTVGQAFKHTVNGTVIGSHTLSDVYVSKTNIFGEDGAITKDGINAIQAGVSS